MNNENARAAMSQHNLKKIRTRLPDNKRKSKARTYQKRVCPYAGCLKHVVRLENHLKDTHKVKNLSEYRKLLRDAVYVNENNLTEEEESMSDDNNEHREVIGVMRKEGKRNLLRYIEKYAEVPIDSEDSSDDDWLISQVSKAISVNSIESGDNSQKGCFIILIFSFKTSVADRQIFPLHLWNLTNSISN